MSHTTFTQSSLSVSSAVVNPFSFAARASSKQKASSLHRNGCEEIERQECWHGRSRSNSTRISSWRREHVCLVLSVANWLASAARRAHWPADLRRVRREVHRRVHRRDLQRVRPEILRGVHGRRFHRRDLRRAHQQGYRHILDDNFDLSILVRQWRLCR